MERLRAMVARVRRYAVEHQRRDERINPNWVCDQLEDIEAHETVKTKLEAAPSKPCAEADWHEVWVWRDSITGKLQTTTGSSELSSIPPVSGMREGCRLYYPQPPAGEVERLRELEAAGEKLAVEARVRLSEITQDNVGHPGWSGPQAQALKAWNEARENLRPEQPPADNSPPSDSQGDQERCGAERLWPEIPRDYWREVPCGHPPDPVAMWSQGEEPVCHCGCVLESRDGLPTPPEAPGPLVHCHKCGCYVAVPPPSDCNPAPTQVEGDDDLRWDSFKPESQPEEGDARLFVSEDKGANERRYRCSACGTKFMVPLDDAALPAERECDGCHRMLPTVREGGDEEDWPGELTIGRETLAGRTTEVFIIPPAEVADRSANEFIKTRRYLPATSQDSSGLRTAYEKARDQLSEAADKQPRLEDLASLLVRDGSAECCESVASELEEIADVLGELPERAIGDDSHFDQLEQRAERAEAALEELAAELEERTVGPEAELKDGVLTEVGEWGAKAEVGANREAASLAREKAAELKEGER